MTKVFVFGNSLIEKDSLALTIAERLRGKVKGVEFEAVESLDEVKNTKEFYIMDVALGIEKVQMIEDLHKLQTAQPVSLHDFDLAFELKLAKKLGKIGKVKIIAIPNGYALDKAVEETRALISILP